MAHHHHDIVCDLIHEEWCAAIERVLNTIATIAPDDHTFLRSHLECFGYLTPQ